MRGSGPARRCLQNYVLWVLCYGDHLLSCARATSLSETSVQKYHTQTLRQAESAGISFMSTRIRSLYIYGEAQGRTWAIQCRRKMTSNHQ